MSIILASQSAARRAVLAGAGVPHLAVTAGVDEDAAKVRLLVEGAGPLEVAQALAEMKAVEVSRLTEGLVIGADQTLDLEGELYDKVADVGAARERLQLLRGKAHRLHSAVVVAEDGRAIWRDVVSATLTMRDFSDIFLEDYLAEEGRAALGSVGCYRLEGVGAQLFSSIEGDYFAILGLPMMGLLELLRERGELTA
ncbi:Maf family protein [uncultured Phenylobacterium sp.]|uniref:Maf family protein n=1 Tax=uncultured Phenylobacterium sp. TaxID=349273 RepID=UPI0025F77691|nr:Maf family protein [uncultured Phenylobacterium sp.]